MERWKYIILYCAYSGGSACGAGGRKCGGPAPRLAVRYNYRTSWRCGSSCGREGTFHGARQVSGGKPRADEGSIRSARIQHISVSPRRTSRHPFAGHHTGNATAGGGHP